MWGIDWGYLKVLWICNFLALSAKKCGIFTNINNPNFTQICCFRIFVSS